MYSFVNTTGAASPGIGRRERKKLETRRAISRAALDLALENGLDNLTVEAISEAADVSPRTFFNYFPSKEDALVTDAARIGDELRPLILERPAGESPCRSCGPCSSNTTHSRWCTRTANARWPGSGSCRSTPP